MNSPWTGSQAKMRRMLDLLRSNKKRVFNLVSGNHGMGIQRFVPGWSAG